MRLFYWGLCAVWVASAAPVPKAVIFQRDVEPVLQARCQTCHRPGEAAPMSLLTYQEARPWAKAIKRAVLARKMPPWFADAAHGSFSNDRRLTAEEIQTLVTWADNGAEEGDPASASKPVTFADGWVMGRPDLVLEMPEAYEVPASGTIEYTYVVVPTGFTEDRWVQQVEVRPGNRSVVHHIVMIVRPPGVKYVSEAPIGHAYVPPAKQPSRKPDNGQGVLQGGQGGSKWSASMCRAACPTF